MSKFDNKKGGAAKLVFELLAVKAGVKVVFSRPYCYYGSLFCLENYNEFTTHWAIC